MITSKVSDGIYMVDTVALGRRGSVAAYVLKGSKVALVDCGYASSSGTVLEGLGELGIPPSSVDYVVPTHIHLDHAGGAGELIRLMPNAKVIAQERGVPHLVDPGRLIQSATSVFGEAAIETYGRPIGIDKERMIAVGEELHVELGGLSFTAIHAPGHAPHQISILIEERRVLIAADAVGAVYPTIPAVMPVSPPPSFDPVELGRTTDRLVQLDAKTLLAPHFGVRNDVRQVLEATKKKTNEWVGTVSQLRKSGSSLDEVAAALKRQVSAESMVAEKDFPPYADVSIRISAMGILHYLEKHQ
ncbi:MAG: MBL fold metallo-hydrolase [Thaumarchaeota archaeon]|nr:MBL fold metallo-hydrolase [Nitrososphaerota archaeon]